MVRDDEDVVTFSTQLSWGSGISYTGPSAPESTFTDVPEPKATIVAVDFADTDDDEDEDDEDDDWGDFQTKPLLKRLVAAGRDRQESMELLDEFNNFLDGGEDEDKVFAAAELVFESRELRSWNYSYIVDRALAAYTYIKAEGDLGIRVSVTHFDNNLYAVTSDWDDWATDHADEMITNEVGIPSSLETYYSFDYDQYAEDLKEDYHLVEIEGSYGTFLVFSL